MTRTAEETLASLNFGTVPSLTETPMEAKVAAAPEDAQEAVLTEDEVNELYLEATELKAAKEAIAAREEAIKSTFRKLAYGSTVPTIAEGIKGAGISIGHNPVFNEARFFVDYPYELAEVAKVVVTDENGVDHIEEQVTYPNRELYVLKPDRSQIKSVLTEDAYKDLFDEGAAKVTIR